MEKPADAVYTVVIDGKPTGPYTLEGLKGIVVKPGTFIRKPGMADYKEAHELPELRELLGFTYQKTAPQYFAAFDQRLLASAIDYFFITMGYLVLVLISFIFITGKEARIAAGVSGLPFLPLVKLIYGSIAEAGPKQATAGKAIVNIKVTDLMGNRLQLGQSFVRNVSKIVSVIPVFFGYLFSFLNRKHQCFHDRIADTLVIKDRLI